MGQWLDFQVYECGLIFFKYGNLPSVASYWGGTVHRISQILIIVGVSMVVTSLIEADIQTVHSSAWGYRTAFTGPTRAMPDNLPASDGLSQLTAHSYRFRHLGTRSSVETDKGALSFDPKPLDISQVVLAIDGTLLNYPNPFALSEGTTIGYRLTKSEETELYVYDMLGHDVLHEHYAAGTQGASQGSNRVLLTNSSFGGDTLSAGVYFYYIVSKGRVLGKGKMAIHP